MNVYDAMKHVKLGTVVQFRDGRLCTVEKFDIRERIATMPLRLKAVFEPADEFDARFDELLAVMVPVEHAG
jgi:hypothetical protein